MRLESIRSPKNPRQKDNEIEKFFKNLPVSAEAEDRETTLDRMKSLIGEDSFHALQTLFHPENSRTSRATRSGTQILPLREESSDDSDGSDNSSGSDDTPLLLNTSLLKKRRNRVISSSTEVSSSQELKETEHSSIPSKPVADSVEL